MSIKSFFQNISSFFTKPTTINFEGSDSPVDDKLNDEYNYVINHTISDKLIDRLKQEDWEKCQDITVDSDGDIPTLIKPLTDNDKENISNKLRDKINETIQFDQIEESIQDSSNFTFWDFDDNGKMRKVFETNDNQEFDQFITNKLDEKKKI